MKNVKARDHIRDTGKDGSITQSEYFKERGNGDVDCINLVQYTDTWQDHVNTLTNVRFA